MTVSGVGTVDIPPSLEVRGGARPSQAVIRKVVIQERRANASGRNALLPEDYVRIIFDPKDNADATALSGFLNGADNASLREESEALRAAVQARGGRVLEWNAPVMGQVGGVRAFCQRYKRQAKGTGADVVAFYTFLVRDRPWALTIVYRENGEIHRTGLLPAVFSSIRVTAATR